MNKFKFRLMLVVECDADVIGVSARNPNDFDTRVEVSNVETAKLVRIKGGNAIPDPKGLNMLTANTTVMLLEKALDHAKRQAEMINRAANTVIKHEPAPAPDPEPVPPKGKLN